MAQKQTAGRERLGDFAPQFAALNDDVLFGEVRSREDVLPGRERSLITIAALMSGGNFEQLKAHIAMGKGAGITQAEIVEVITQLALYVGWLKAWTTFGIAREIYEADQ